MFASAQKPCDYTYPGLLHSIYLNSMQSISHFLTIYCHAFTHTSSTRMSTKFGHPAIKNSSVDSYKLLIGYGPFILPLQNRTPLAA